MRAWSWSSNLIFKERAFLSYIPLTPAKIRLDASLAAREGPQRLLAKARNASGRIGIFGIKF